MIFSRKESPNEANQTKVPSGAVALYNIFIHGGMSRRILWKDCKKFATGGVAVAALPKH